MQQVNWAALLCRIPETYHDGLTLATSTGAELVIQEILQVEEEFLIIRGRASGTSDRGKIVVVPYLQINYLSFKDVLTDSEVRGIFGADQTEFAEEQELEQANDNQVSEQDLAEPGQSSPHGDEKESDQSIAPSKAQLLAKLRARLAESSRGSS